MRSVDIQRESKVQGGVHSPLDRVEIVDEDFGRRVSYRWKGEGPVRQVGTLIRLARAKYGPGAIVHYDGRIQPQFVYLSDLRWETPECRWQYALTEAIRISKFGSNEDGR